MSFLPYLYVRIWVTSLFSTQGLIIYIPTWSQKVHLSFIYSFNLFKHFRNFFYLLFVVLETRTSRNSFLVGRDKVEKQIIKTQFAKYYYCIKSGNSGGKITYSAWGSRHNSGKSWHSHWVLEGVCQVTKLRLGKNKSSSNKL